MSMPSLPELKRLFSPFPNVARQAEAERYWLEHTADERNEAMHEVLRAFYAERGVDIDRPVMDRTIRRVTLDEKNRQHEEWHRDLDRFMASE